MEQRSKDRPGRHSARRGDSVMGDRREPTLHELEIIEWHA